MWQVANSEIDAHYHTEVIFAVATHYEGFGIPVLAAMATGLPAVASATGSIPEVVADADWIVEKGPAVLHEPSQN